MSKTIPVRVVMDKNPAPKLEYVAVTSERAKKIASFIEAIEADKIGLILNGEVQPFQKRYSDLLAVIGDIGKDVKPSYTSSKMAMDKLKRNVTLARTLLKECQSDLDKLKKQ